MKKSLMALAVVSLLGLCGSAYAESNIVAVTTEKVTKAPMTMLQRGSDFLNSPLNELTNLAILVTDKTREKAVSLGLNMGKPIEN